MTELPDRIGAALDELEERYDQYLAKARHARANGDSGLAAECLWQAHGIVEASYVVKQSQVPAELAPTIGPGAALKVTPPPRAAA